MVATLVCAAAFAACGGGGVVGKTYVFEDYTITYPDDLDQSSRDNYASMRQLYIDSFSTYTMKFGKDGFVEVYLHGTSMGGFAYEVHTEDGTVSTRNNTYKIDGNLLILENVDDGVTFKTVYKQKGLF